jgi:hypothetical protein
VENGKLAAQKSELEDLIEKISKSIQDPETDYDVTVEQIAEFIDQFADDKKEQNNG